MPFSLANAYTSYRDFEDGWSWATRIYYDVCSCLCPVHPFPASIVFGDVHTGWQHRLLFYSDFFLPSRSQTLVNCTSLDFLRYVVYFYNRWKIIYATSKHLERDKCWQVGCRYGCLNKPVVYTTMHKNFMDTPNTFPVVIKKHMPSSPSCVVLKHKIEWFN